MGSMRPLLAALPLLAACGSPHVGTDEPTATFVARSVVPLGEEVVFDGSLSTDNGLIVSYAFDFGDDTPALVSFSPRVPPRHAPGGRGGRAREATLRTARPGR